MVVKRGSQGQITFTGVDNTTENQTNSVINPHEMCFGVVNPPVHHVTQGAINADLC